MPEYPDLRRGARKGIVILTNQQAPQPSKSIGISHDQNRYRTRSIASARHRYPRRMGRVVVEDDVNDLPAGTSASMVLRNRMNS
jgi:hypothetical protein